MLELMSEGLYWSCCSSQVKICFLTLTMFSQFDPEMMTLNQGYGSSINRWDCVAVLNVLMYRFVVWMWFVDIAEAPTYDQDGHKAGDGGVPVAAGGGRLPHQDAVEDEISEAELHSPCRRGRVQRSTSTSAHSNQEKL